MEPTVSTIHLNEAFIRALDSIAARDRAELARVREEIERLGTWETAELIIKLRRQLAAAKSNGNAGNHV